MACVVVELAGGIPPGRSSAAGERPLGKLIRAGRTAPRPGSTPPSLRSVRARRGARVGAPAACDRAGERLVRRVGVGQLPRPPPGRPPPGPAAVGRWSLVQNSSRAGASPRTGGTPAWTGHKGGYA